MGVLPEPRGRRVLLSGGPGGGKTTLLESLEAQGHATVPEAARAIIRARRARGLSPRPQPLAFALLILRRELARYRRPPAGSTFFDRGVVDAAWMLVQADPGREAQARAIVERHRYHPVAFLLPPWRAIYARDAERDQDFDEARRVHAALRDWYRACGYRVVEVPCAPVATRRDYVLAALGDAAVAAPPARLRTARSGQCRGRPPA